MSCKVISSTNEKESALYNELLKVLGTHELAEENFARVMGNDFKEFFGDWVVEYNSEYSENPQMLSRVNEMGEPKLFTRNNQHYFEGANGDRMFLDKQKFSEFSSREVEEVTNQLLYDFVTRSGNRSFNELDTDNDLKPSDLLPSIEKSMNDYIDTVSEYEGTEELVDRANLVLKYKTQFEEEILNKMEALGQSVKSRLVTPTGDNLDEIPEDSKDAILNLKESFENNSKDSATVNTKLFLSQIVDIKIEDGNYVKSTGDYLKKHRFASFEEVWSTLEPRLADVVGHGHGQNVQDVYDNMMAEIENLEFAKPWVLDLIDKMDALSDDKRTEFVQAFSKTRLNFYVTEVNGDKYKVINATSTNSRSSKVVNQWGVNFNEKFKPTMRGLSDVKKTALTNTKQSLLDAHKAFQETVKSTKQDSFEGLSKNVTELSDIMNSIGMNVDPDDFNKLILSHGGEKYAFREVSRMFRATNRVIDHMLKDNVVFVDMNGEFQNPFSTESDLKDLASAISMSHTDIAENTVLMNDGKMGWTYASPSYLSNKVNEWKADRDSLEQLALLPYNKNSYWIKYLLGTEQERNTEDRLDISQERLSKLELGLASSFKSAGKNDGTDNKETSYTDAVNDNIVKILGGRLRGGKSYFPTIVPADKSRRIELTGVPMIDSGIDVINSSFYVSPETVDLFVNYFEDEYTRMKIVAGEIDTLPDSKKIVHYHTKSQNGLKSQIFPEFSFDSETISNELKDALYDVNGRPLSTVVGGLDESQKELLYDEIKKTLETRTRETLQELRAVDNISSTLLKSYGTKKNAETALAGDYLVNGLVASIEYMKMFSGDPAYYKNTSDLIKRIPATYTDGLQLRLKNSDHLWFNQATIAGVEVASQYVNLIADSVKDKSIVKAYKRVNTTDAQAWITPNRWRFLKKRLGQWSPLHDKVFTKMMNNEGLSKKETKIAAQPLKGVYFEINQGRPVYLKYSQAVLIPSLVAGTPMEAVYDKMTKDSDGNPFENAKDEIHEVITIDGVKVGAMHPSPIHDEGTTSISGEFELNPVSLTNRGWKLQQDLPIKGLKATKVGSQIQKNILANIKLDGKYEIDGKVISGAQLLKQIHDTVSDLSNLGKEQITNEFGIKDGKITNLDRVYSALVDEFKSRGGGNNVVSALEKEMPFDAIPQVRGKIQSIFMSMMNKEMVKIKTNGGSLIQVSPFGMENIKDRDASGIKIVSNNYDGKGLKPPRIENGKVLPGQAMIPYSALRAILKSNDVDYDSMTGDQLMKYIDPSALQMVTYRIPNQGMSSNDAIEIVGILPDGMGDSIIAYDGVPAKTGSDFDIDKMFVMMHNLEFKDGKVQKIVSDSKKGLQNKLVDMYNAVLTSTETYDDMMRSIDADFFKDDIVDLFPEEKMGNLQLFSPITQIKTKFSYLSGKFGVAQTANQLVDHVLNQTMNIRFNGYLGIGHQDSYGNTKFDEIYDTNDERSISDTVSAFLNAYVDIAKDPYVSRGNHNSVTANPAFMLVRAGVPITWVNRFIGQPILIELVEAIKNSEGKTSERLEVKGKKADAYALLRDKYGFKKSKKSTEALVRTEKQMEKSIGKDISAMPIEELNFQGEILDLFEDYVDKSKHFGASVMASKADTNGGGGSFMDRLIIANKFADVISKGKILGFDEKFKDTMLGTYHANAVDWVGEVVSNSDIFLSATSSLEETFNSISNRMGKGTTLMSKQLAKDLDASYYSYAMSGTKLFKDNRAEHDRLFTEVPSQVIKLQEENADNFLLNELTVKISGGKKFLTIDNKNKPAIYNDKIHRAWMAMYKSPEYKQLAVDLVKYSYSQSGFQQNLGQFFTLIPHEILSAEGISWDVKNMFNTVKDLSMDSNFRDQFFRHKADDNNVVPMVSGSNVSAVGKFHTGLGFMYNEDTEGNSISTGTNEAGIPTYPQFVSRKFFPDEMRPDHSVNYLYALMGMIKDSEGKYKPVYSRTHKLGFKSNFGAISEYQFDTNVEKSLVGANNLNSNVLENRNNFNNFVISDPEHIPSDVIMDATNGPKETHLDEMLMQSGHTGEKLDLMIQMSNVSTKYIGGDIVLQTELGSEKFYSDDLVMVTDAEFTDIEDDFTRAVKAKASFAVQKTGELETKVMDKLEYYGYDKIVMDNYNMLSKKNCN